MYNPCLDEREFLLWLFHELFDAAESKLLWHGRIEAAVSERLESAALHILLRWTDRIDHWEKQVALTQRDTRDSQPSLAILDRNSDALRPHAPQRPSTAFDAYAQSSRRSIHQCWGPMPPRFPCQKFPPSPSSPVHCPTIDLDSVGLSDPLGSQPSQELRRRHSPTLFVGTRRSAACYQDGSRPAP